MTTEYAILLSAIAIAISIYFGMVNKNRDVKTDTKKDTTEMTTVIVKLENISNGVADIKQEMSSVKEDGRKNRESIIRLDESMKQAHKRLDAYDRRKEEDI